MITDTTASPVITRDESRALFGQTMGFVALTSAFFALGAYLGRDMAYQWGWLWFIVAIVCLFGAERRGAAVRAGRHRPLLTFGLVMGLAVAPTIAYYVSSNPQAVWQAGGATALFIAGFGAAGYATRRDLSNLARLLFFALLALIIFGIVTIFVRIPNGQLIYAVLGLIIFAGFTMIDFQRLRRSKDIRVAPLLAASIFLDVLNVFLFFLSIFGRR